MAAFGLVVTDSWDMAQRARHAKMFRMQILIRSSGRRRLVETVSEALAPLDGTAARRSIHVDVDPVSLL